MLKFTPGYDTIGCVTWGIFLCVALVINSVAQETLTDYPETVNEGTGRLKVYAGLVIYPCLVFVILPILLYTMSPGVRKNIHFHFNNIIRGNNSF